jgi:hypothetical protein
VRPNRLLLNSTADETHAQFMFCTVNLMVHKRMHSQFHSFDKDQSLAHLRVRCSGDHQPPNWGLLLMNTLHWEARSNQG